MRTAEVAIGISLLLGLFVRASATVGALLILNIYFGLYRSESEWPWTYAFLVLLMVLLAVERASCPGQTAGLCGGGNRRDKRRAL
jgi:uncharacterized membrane protein YphA (DoxX/SURF4 family)